MNNTEAKLTLHTAGGDVVSTFRLYEKEQMEMLRYSIAAYIADEKSFTVSYA